ncbi:ribosomal protein S5 domain 2-type protein [Cristinia sonorae]|uniref:Ribosomal RNA-processing protein 43 n=1 Tax=Cristinia sonorae TaxID=1940300 RepID=A0A8K0XN65_9AGAR|nr:ribosomal protein S5 domain 2-type protein [Cristinia sonorae]
MAASEPSSSKQPVAGPYEQIALKAATFRRLHPKLYLERFLAENVRPDGRSFDEWRDVSVNVGSISTADGSALVRMGDTTVVCGVKAEIAEPELDRPEHGFLVPNIDLPAMCSPKFKPGPPSEEAQILSERLNEVLVASNIIPTTSLCIKSGKSAWVLYVDATCINYDGNVFDAALLAMVSALKNTRLPQATYNEETERTTCTRKTMVPLDIAGIPISSSFGIFDATHILADPTTFEEPLLDTTFTITLDDSGGIVSVVQLGLGMAAAGLIGGGKGDVLNQCIEAAKRRSADVRRVLGNVDSRTRN